MLLKNLKGPSMDLKNTLIFKTKLPGYWTFIFGQLKVSVLISSIFVAYVFIGNTVIPGFDKFQTALVGIVILFAYVNLVSVVLTTKSFAKRDDEFVFQGYFPLEVVNKNASDVFKILEDMGYQPGSSKYPGITMQRLAWPGPEFSNNHLNFRPYLVNIQESNSGIQMRFFDPKHEFEFDGMQVAYNAAQEFKRAIGEVSFLK